MGKSEKSGAAHKPADAAALWRLALDLPFVMAVEALRFMGHRLSAQADFLSDLAHSSGVGGAVLSYRDFMESAAADYRAEAKALAKTAQDVIPA